MQNLHEKIGEQEKYVIALRRHFATYPEVGGQEFQTQAKIIEELESMGLQPRKAAGTGVIAELKGGLPGKTVAIRADIDALPLQDELDKPYRSQHDGVKHGCGHDAHTAMLLGAAKVFTAIRAEVPGTIRFLFQPSEERLPGGAVGIIAAGGMEGVDAVIGQHIWQMLPSGTVGVTYGPMMAESCGFYITLNGKGGHSSQPQETIDPVLLGAQLVMALRTLVPAHIDARDAAVLVVSTFQAGEAFNVIPDKAVLKGTLRSLDQEVRKKVFAKAEEICTGLCAATGATFQLEVEVGYPPVMNDPKVTKVLAEVGEQVLGAGKVQEIRPVMGGEDFSYYQQKAPGAFLLLGSANEAKGIRGPHHHPKFDVDEAVLKNGVEIMVRTAFRLAQP